MVGGENTSKTVGVTAPIVSQTLVSNGTPEMVIPPIQQTSFSIHIVVTPTTVGGIGPPFPSMFYTSPSGGEYPYSMPTSLMTGLHTNVSMYTDNAMVFSSLSIHICHQYLLQTIMVKWVILKEDLDTSLKLCHL